MKIVHISDTHGPKHHTHLVIPECDVVVFTGDLGGRTMLLELSEFLVWFESLPAQRRIFIPGNHDLILDPDWITRQRNILPIFLEQQHRDALELIKNYKVIYLNNKDYVYNGVKFWGSPMTPSFHREHWAFNADRGQEIMKTWAKIPSDVNVLLTHGPGYGTLDDVREFKKEGEDPHRGCVDLMNVIKKRLFDLKLHCFGHIHDNYGIVQEQVSNSRRVLFSNGAVLNNSYTQLITEPLIINI